MESINEDLNHIAGHITKALDAILNGTCKQMGAAHLTAALATLHGVQDTLRRRYDPPPQIPKNEEVIYYR
jgi:hypothetical protein